VVIPIFRAEIATDITVAAGQSLILQRCIAIDETVDSVHGLSGFVWKPIAETSFVVVTAIGTEPASKTPVVAPTLTLIRFAAGACLPRTAIAVEECLIVWSDVTALSL
jgi:hypothetical protein